MILDSHALPGSVLCRRAFGQHPAGALVYIGRCCEHPRTHLSGAYVCVSAACTSRREFPGHRLCIVEAGVNPAQWFSKRLSGHGLLPSSSTEEFQLPLGLFLTPSSFSLISKEHLQLSYLCVGFLFLRLLPMGSEPHWFFLCNSFLIPTVPSSPTAIPLILSSFSPGWAIPLFQS